MNVFNRVFLIGIALLLLVLTGWTLLIVLGVQTPNRVALWFQEGLAELIAVERGVWNTTIALTAALFVLALVLLVSEFTSIGKRQQQLLVKRDGLGEVLVSRTGLERLVEHVAGSVDGIWKVKSDITQAADGLHVVNHISVAPASHIPELTSKLQERIKSALEEHVGRPVREVTVLAQLSNLKHGRRVQ